MTGTGLDKGGTYGAGVGMTVCCCSMKEIAELTRESMLSDCVMLTEIPFSREKTLADGCVEPQLRHSSGYLEQSIFPKP